MKPLAALLNLSLLTACGAAGMPQPPADPVKPGVSISAEASMGIAKNGTK